MPRQRIEKCVVVQLLHSISQAKCCIDHILSYLHCLEWLIMHSERRKYPRVTVGGEASILLAGVVCNGRLMNVSPSDIQIECQHNLIEHLGRHKLDSGLYPDFEFEFTLPASANLSKTIRSICTVSYCRRQRQDSYHLGLSFVALDKKDEKTVDAYIKAPLINGI